MSDVQKGLDGVIVDESKISKVEGDKGNLWYAGYHIDDLAEQSSFEEVVHLLSNQHLPDRDELDSIQQILKKERTIPPQVEDLIEDIADADPMAVLRTSISLLGALNESASQSGEVNMEEVKTRLVSAIAKFPTIIAYNYRQKQGLEPIEPREDLSHAGNFLYMLNGEEPSEEQENAMDTALILYADHGMNASTFSACVTASTLATPHGCLTSAIATLEGDLHGGAAEDVIDHLEDIGSPENADEWAEKRIKQEKLISGFGHRVYNVVDPRCDHFRRRAEELGETKYLPIAEALREAVDKRLGDKKIKPNTDLYSGTLYNALGVPKEFYVALFAMSRVAGWSAHIVEQLEDNRIIRPRVKYVGETGKQYTPIQDR